MEASCSNLILCMIQEQYDTVIVSADDGKKQEKILISDSVLNSKSAERYG